MYISIHIFLCESYEDSGASELSALAMLEKTRALARVSATFARKSDALARCFTQNMSSRSMFYSKHALSLESQPLVSDISRTHVEKTR